MDRRLVLLPCIWACLTAGLVAQTRPDTPAVAFSGYIQPQYQVEFGQGRTRDRTSIRRMVLSLDAELSKNWHAQVQADAGPLTSGGDRLIVKNAIVQFTGWQPHGITITAGNQKLPFSRSVLASSSRRGLVERPFTGDRAYGSPGRAISLKVDGWHRDRTLHWSAALADTRFGFEGDEIRLDGPAEIGSDGYEGQMLAGRLELHPLGEVTRDHGDFEHGPWRYTLGAAAYGWWNDNDTAPAAGSVSARTVGALELSGAARGNGLSVDVEFDRVGARSRNTVPDTDIFVNGEASLWKGSIEAGYMLVGNRLETLAGLDALDVDAFDATWRRLAIGMNWYVRRHGLKFSVMHRESFNERGRAGVRSRAVYLQTQFAF